MRRPREEQSHTLHNGLRQLHRVSSPHSGRIEIGGSPPPFTAVWPSAQNVSSNARLSTGPSLTSRRKRDADQLDIPLRLIVEIALADQRRSARGTNKIWASPRDGLRLPVDVLKCYPAGSQFRFEKVGVFQKGCPTLRPEGFQRIFLQRLDKELADDKKGIRDSLTRSLSRSLEVLVFDVFANVRHGASGAGGR